MKKLNQLACCHSEIYIVIFAKNNHADRRVGIGSFVMTPQGKWEMRSWERFWHSTSPALQHRPMAMCQALVFRNIFRLPWKVTGPSNKVWAEEEGLQLLTWRESQFTIPRHLQHIIKSLNRSIEGLKRNEGRKGESGKWSRKEDQFSEPKIQQNGHAARVWKVSCPAYCHNFILGAYSLKSMNVSHAGASFLPSRSWGAFGISEKD